MGVRIGPRSIISVAVVTEPKFHHLSQMFEQGHGLIDSGQTGEGEIGLHPVENLIRAEMLLIGGEDF